MLIAAIYGIALSLLFIYGVNILYLSWITSRCRPQATGVVPPTEFPLVTVQLPIYNELYVAKRVVEAVVRLDWPALEIQVLDDSTDETQALLAGLVERYHSQGVNITHLHRAERIGYKAGALAEGLQQANGEYIAIFDADFLPAPDFLRQTMPAFANPHTGFVQARWGHLNAPYSLLTQFQSLAIDAHFAVEQYARAQAGFLMNFNGTGGVWRKAAIESAGGWQAHTLTEDLDLSYRAQLAGWQAAYLRDVVVPGEIPVTLNAFRRQQNRWARGSIQCAMRLLPRVWRASLPLMTKFQATLHLTGYAIQLLMVIVAVLYPWVLLLDYTRIQPLFNLTAIFTLTFLAPTLYFALGQREIGNPLWQRWPLILGLNLLGAGMMYHHAWSVVAALFSRQAVEFERTPKFGITQKHDSWQQKTYQLRFQRGLIFEGLMLLYNLNTVRLAVLAESWSIAFYALIFALGGLLILALTVAELPIRWHTAQRYSQQEI